MYRTQGLTVLLLLSFPTHMEVVSPTGPLGRTGMVGLELNSLSNILIVNRV